jgi:hypothetical protein
MEKRYFLILAALLSFALSLFGCAPAEEAALTLSESDDDIAQADMHKALDLFRAAETDEAKSEALNGFLTKHPNSQYTPFIVRSLARILHPVDDAAQATLIREYLNKMTHKEGKISSLRILAVIYSRSNDLEGIKAVLSEIESPNSHIYIMAAGVGFEADDLAFAKENTDAALAMATPEQIRANADGELTDKQVQSQSDSILGKALVYKARYLLAEGNKEAAMAALAGAAASTTFNIAGYAHGSNLNKDWATILIDEGDYEAAMIKVAPDAIFAGNEDAVAIYTTAYIANGGLETDLEEAMWEHRLKLAPKAPDFTALDYDNNSHNFKDLKGKVTYLSFWFPT